MWQRLLASALYAACLWACGDDAATICRAGRCGLPGTGAPAPGLAGSCNHESQALCDEYAVDTATPGTQGECTAAGGKWSTGQCPFDARTGVCFAGTPATRSFAYSEAAATGLMSSCPAGKFKPIAGSMMTGGMAPPTGGTGGPMMMPDAGASDATLGDATLGDAQTVDANAGM